MNNNEELILKLAEAVKEEAKEYFIKKVGLTKIAEQITNSKHNNEDEFDVPTKDALAGAAGGVAGGLLAQQVSERAERDFTKRYYQEERGLSEEEAIKKANKYIKERKFWEAPFNNKVVMMGLGALDGFGIANNVLNKRYEKEARNKRSREMDDFIEASKALVPISAIVGGMEGGAYSFRAGRGKEGIVNGAGKGALIGAGTGLGAAALYTGIHKLLGQREEDIYGKQ